MRYNIKGVKKMKDAVKMIVEILNVVLLDRRQWLGKLTL